MSENGHGFLVYYDKDDKFWVDTCSVFLGPDGKTVTARGHGIVPEGPFASFEAAAQDLAKELSDD